MCVCARAHVRERVHACMCMHTYSGGACRVYSQNCIHAAFAPMAILCTIMRVHAAPTRAHAPAHTHITLLHVHHTMQGLELHRLTGGPRAAAEAVKQHTHMAHTHTHAHAHTGARAAATHRWSPCSSKGSEATHTHGTHTHAGARAAATHRRAPSSSRGSEAGFENTEDS